MSFGLIVLFQVVIGISFFMLGYSLKFTTVNEGEDEYKPKEVDPLDAEDYYNIGYRDGFTDCENGMSFPEQLLNFNKEE